MPALLSFLLVLVVSKEVLYFNEELLVISSFISFLLVISFAIGSLVGTSLDASIREVTDEVSSKISDYTHALEANRETFANQLAISSGCPSLVANSLGSIFSDSEPSLLKPSTLNKVLNIVMARSLLESNQAVLHDHPSLALAPRNDEAQFAVLAGAHSPVSDSCFVSLPSDTLILTVLNSLLVSSLR